MSDLEISIRQGESFRLESDFDLDAVSSVFENLGINFESSYNSITQLVTLPYSYVGYLQLGGKKVIINPKYEEFTISEVYLMRLLTYDFDFSNTIISNFNTLTKSYETLPILTKLFTEELKKIIKVGLPIDFIKSTKHTNYVLGEIDLEGTVLNRYLKKDKPIVTKLNKLTLDNSVNQLFKKVLHKIKNNIPPKDFYYLDQHLLCRIPDNNHFITKISQNRKNLYVNRLVEFSKMILFDLLPITIDGNKVGEAFIINYDRLFEDFMFKVLKSSTKGYVFTKPVESIVYGKYIVDDTRYNKEYIPDITLSWSGSNDIDGIIDVKNKLPKFFNNNDVYQITFYCNENGIKVGILLYPTMQTKKEIQLELLNQSDVTIYAVFFNIKSLLSGSFEKEVSLVSDKVLSLLS